MTANNQYFGKYSGTVLNNIDPMQRGRLQVMVPAVTSLVPTTWAEACVPLAGPTGPPMGIFTLPPIGAGVWVEFEAGDPGRPIWTGCRWGSQADIPPLARLGNPADPNIVMQTLLQNTIVISDLPGPTGGIMLKSMAGAMILINEVGITISNGLGATIMMNGPTVNINNGALIIT